MDYGYNNQYSTTSYGAQGGAGGGGFMNNGSQQEKEGGSKGFGKDTLRPVTIKQLVDAQQPHPDADFRIDGNEITQVTFIGQIRNISQQATNYTYKLDDGTGTIEVKQWIDPEAASATDEDNKDKLTENAYARVWGRLKAFNNKRHVGALVIRPITDYNEVQYHLLEATAVHLHYTKGPPAAKDGAPANGNYGQQNQGQNGADGSYSNGAAAGGQRRLPDGLSNSARRIFQCINTTPQSNEGLHMQDLASRLNIEMAEVGKAGDELLNQGLIYTTVDDQTWAILDEF